MYSVREKWTDERLDDLNKRVDDGFTRMDARFDRIDDRFGRIDARLDSIGRAIIFGTIALSSSTIAGFVAIATQL